MKLKANALCQIRFENSWIMPSALMAVFSFFLLIAYYFGVANFTRCSAFELIFSMILPMLVMIAMMVLLRGIRFPVTPVYGILAAAYSLLLMICSLSDGGTLNILQALLVYLPGSFFALAVTFGFLPKPWVMAVIYLVAAGLRLILTAIPLLFSLQLVELMSGVSVLFGLLSFGMLALSFDMTQPKHMRKKPMI